MRFRPCIDIHNGQVKQIVGGSLSDAGDTAKENYVSEKSGAWYASLYREKDLPGGHIILLNPVSSPFYEADAAQALSALAEWPGNLQVGGGIRPENAGRFLDAGASHVIVTSYVFSDGRFHPENLEKMLQAVGRSRLVLDLSCRKKDGQYYVVTDRWQKFTGHVLTPAFCEMLADSCAEFLVHAADAEGKASGIEKELVSLLSSVRGLPVTYAGGVGSYEDLYTLKKLGKDRMDVTVGSALDLFGGPLSFETILQICREPLPEFPDQETA